MEPVSQRDGKAHDKLSVRNHRQHILHHMRRRFGLTLGCAARAKPASFAGKRHDFFFLAAAALQPDESIRQYPAAQIGLEFIFDIAWHWARFCLALRKEATEMLLNYLVAGSELRPAPSVGERFLGLWFHPADGTTASTLPANDMAACR